MEVRCNPAALRAYCWELKARREKIAEALEVLKKAYMALDWEDHMALVTEQILNRHIDTMNGELSRLGKMIRALEELTDCADDYTSYEAVDVKILC